MAEQGRFDESDHLYELAILTGWGNHTFQSRQLVASSMLKRAQLWHETDTDRTADYYVQLFKRVSGDSSGQVRQYGILALFELAILHYGEGRIDQAYLYREYARKRLDADAEIEVSVFSNLDARISELLATHVEAGKVLEKYRAGARR